jgi:hypothetical protein
MEVDHPFSIANKGAHIIAPFVTVECKGVNNTVNWGANQNTLPGAAMVYAWEELREDYNTLGGEKEWKFTPPFTIVMNVDNFGIYVY